MCLPTLAILLLLAVALAPDPGASSSTAPFDEAEELGDSDVYSDVYSDYGGYDSDEAVEDDEDPELEGAAVPTAAHLLGLDSLDDLHAHGGAPVQYPIDLDKLVVLCYDGWSNADMAEELGCPVSVVDHRKRQLGLTWLRQKPWMPDCQLLEEWWRLNPSITIAALAAVLVVSSTTLRRHMRRVGFRPSKGRRAPDEEMMRAVEEIKARKVVTNLGRTFLEGALINEYGIWATDRQIRIALRTADPVRGGKRGKKSRKAQRKYRVAGPRSLYHADAHEKIAKTYGIWVHGLIDGYSRFIIYLSAATNKKSETVRRLYRGACMAVGWPSRCRWDKGTENEGARKEQLWYWCQRRDDWETRGSVLVGRSVQNCRIEYIWRPVHEHVTGPFRERFDAMVHAGVLDPAEPTDLFCLHAVFLRLVQNGLNKFAGMWNIRKIRGERTVQGRGGGRPIELFHDPVGSEALLDDERAATERAGYGEDTAFRDPGEPEDTDVKVDELRTQDPLEGVAMLQEVRAAYFEAHPLGDDDAGEADYQRYKLVCHELLEAMAYFDGETLLFDWPAFAASQAEHHLSCQLQLRWELANAALNSGVLGW